MEKLKNFLIFFILVFFLQVASPLLPLCAGGEAIPAKVTDISNRQYEKAVINLLDNAKESIVIAMYNITPGEGEKSPVKLLLNDLLEARARGVSVTLYLNSWFKDREDKGFIDSPWFKQLEDAGCTIYVVPQARRLHDKLIIVDNRYVVVGSSNWSNSALRRNFESNTLIDSSEHAKEKLKHIEDIFDFIQSNSEITHSPIYIQQLPEELFIPDELLTNKKYFSYMVTKQDERAFDLYLLLLAHSQAEEEKEFYINLEDMGLSLAMPGDWDYSTLRRQVIKSLKKLKKRYKLIDVEFLHGKDAHIKLKSPKSSSQGSFAVSTASVISPGSSGLSLRLKFLVLIRAFLEKEGEGLYSISKITLAERFGVDKMTIYEAFDDLEEFILSEVEGRESKE